jgi:thiamine kinase-like enzyme
MAEQFIKSLSGHSGCEISLFKDGDHFFVRKTAGRVDYNKRLRLQIAKQVGYRPAQNSKIHVPQIYKTGIENDIFFFDMEYLNCMTIAQYMESVSIKEISTFIDLLAGELHINDSVIMPDTNDIFQKKIQSLYKNIPDDEIYKGALKRLENFDFSNVPYSKCHGDLTLENILLDVKGDIYLIDFLDSFFDSWMIDVAKLLQDLELGWSYRHETISSNLELRLALAKDDLIKHIESLPNGDEKVLQIYYILLLNVMRIVPYTKDDETKEFLHNAIIKLNKILDTKEK